MSLRRTTSKGYEHALRLRKNPTPAEQKLWTHLRGNKLLGVSFRRQHAIGPYVTDFCSTKLKLIIELDGNPHRGQPSSDEQRTKYFESQGYKVIRFWNDQVISHVDDVIRQIMDVLPHPLQ